MSFVLVVIIHFISILPSRYSAIKLNVKLQGLILDHQINNLKTGRLSLWKKLTRVDEGR